MHFAKRHRQLQQFLPCSCILFRLYQLVDLSKGAVGIIEVRIIKVDETLTEVLRLIEIGHAAAQGSVIQRKVFFSFRRDVIPELHVFGKDHSCPPVRYIKIDVGNYLLTFSYQHYTIKP